MMFLREASDHRIPVRVVPAEAVAGRLPPAWAVLVPEGLATGVGTVERVRPGRTAHLPGCACCTPRAAVAEALNRLFLRRARGEVGAFRCVLAALPRDEVEAAFRDILVSARFRLEPDAGPALPAGHS